MLGPSLFAFDKIRDFPVGSVMYIYYIYIYIYIYYIYIYNYHISREDTIVYRSPRASKIKTGRRICTSRSRGAIQRRAPLGLAHPTRLFEIVIPHVNLRNQFLFLFFFFILEIKLK